MRPIANKKIAAAAAGAVLVASAGAAYAYWTTTGAGTGAATAGTSVAGDAVQLVQASTNTGFSPGSAAQDVTLTAKNPAAYDQVVGEVTVTLAGSTACPAANWDLVNVADEFGNVAAGVTTAAQKVATLQLKETGLNQDGCKGAVPALTFSSAAGK